MSKLYLFDKSQQHSEGPEGFKGKSLIFPESQCQNAHFPNKIQCLH